MTTPVPTPIELTGAIQGIRFHSMHADRGIVISCELATRLVDMVTVLQRHNITAVDVISSYREEPRESFHTMGLALDVNRFRTQEGGLLSVENDFAVTPAFETCSAPSPTTPSAQRLIAIACDLADTGKFSSVLTPNYNVGHRDHFHFDIRPDDPRIFVR
jgi:hypothetical protein